MRGRPSRYGRFCAPWPREKACATSSAMTLRVSVAAHISASVRRAPGRRQSGIGQAPDNDAVFVDAVGSLPSARIARVLEHQQHGRGLGQRTTEIGAGFPPLGQMNSSGRRFPVQHDATASGPRLMGEEVSSNSGAAALRTPPDRPCKPPAFTPEYRRRRSARRRRRRPLSPARAWSRRIAGQGL